MEKSKSKDIIAIEHLIKEAIDAYVARDWDGFTSFFKDDAIWMPPDQTPLIGKDAWWSWIGKGWDKTIIDEMVSLSEEIIVAGDWAYE